LCCDPFCSSLSKFPRVSMIPTLYGGRPDPGQQIPLRLAPAGTQHQVDRRHASAAWRCHGVPLPAQAQPGLHQARGVAFQATRSLT
jgi:hypothetical protein